MTYRGQSVEADYRENRLVTGRHESMSFDVGLHLQKAAPVSREIGFRLEDAVKRAVIPRLYAGRFDRLAEADPADVEDGFELRCAADHLFALAIAANVVKVDTYLRQLLAGGLALPVICQEVVVPAMDRIGRLWEDDEMSFADVSIKTACLQQAFGSALSKRAVEQSGAACGRVLISVVPGEDHGFGASVLATLLEDAGFTVDRLQKPTIEALCRKAADADYAVIGLSCGSERTLDGLAGTVEALRKASRNPTVKIVVGGWALQNCAASVDSYSADLVVIDGRIAVTELENLMKSEATAPFSRRG